MAANDTNPAANLSEQLSGLLANRDIVFAFGVILILGMLFVPLPPALLDFGLAASLSLAVLILMVALWIPSPLEFNSFPTLLLVVTMLRLALNVSSTRLILSEGHTGTGAAGQVIEGFSRFMVGGDFVIGIVIFCILVIINFIVITRGSTRIAEVAARFSLDAMPGKQMAIDADLGAGMITEEEARARRKVLEDESSFFGAMDGASKFVRGDAIAGLIITLINVVGGILIGIISHDLTAGQAVSSYTILTIGDGLVTQIPALVVSLSAGLLVTKGGTRGAANEAVLGQLSNFPRALYMASGLCFVIGFLPGFPFVIFSLLAAGMAFLGYTMQGQLAEQLRAQAEADRVANEPQQKTEETIEDLLKLDDLRLEMGSALVPLISSPEAALPGKVKSLRSLFIGDFGFVIPPVRIKDNSTLPPMSYAISIHGVETATGEVRPGAMMLIEPGGQEIDIPGERTKEPTFGLNAVWVDQSRASEAESRGYTVVDPESVITTHLTEIIKEHMPDLLTYAATQELMESQTKDYQKLLTDISNPSPLVLLQHVLQTLLGERISIRNLPRIIEAVAEATATTKKVQQVVEHVRTQLSKQICQNLTDEGGYVPVMTLGQSWETELHNSISKNGEEVNFIMSPQRIQEFVLAVRTQVQQFADSDQWPALLVAPDSRPYVRSILERVTPMTPVISHNEIHRKASLKTVATIG